jgi:hypothetical protein
MADLTQGTLFILACAFLYGLTVFLFRDQITSRRQYLGSVEPPLSSRNRKKTAD